MWEGGSKSGSPISRGVISRPRASSALAFARTEKAVSVPKRSIRLASLTPILLCSIPPYHTPHYITHHGWATLQAMWPLPEAGRLLLVGGISPRKAFGLANTNQVLRQPEPRRYAVDKNQQS